MCHGRVLVAARLISGADIGRAMVPSGVAGVVSSCQNTAALLLSFRGWDLCYVSAVFGSASVCQSHVLVGWRFDLANCCGRE